MKKFISNNAILIHKMFNAMANNLVKVFIPLLILKKCNNLCYCVIFLVIQALLTATLNYILNKAIKNKPLTMIVLHIIPVCLLQFLITLNSQINIFWVIVYAGLLSLGQTLYSVSANNYFMFEKKDKKNNAGKMEIGSNIGKIIMILIGGFILNTSTINYIITICIVASIFYLISVYPLITIKNNYSESLTKQLNYDQSKDIFTSKDKILYAIYHCSFGIYQAFLDTVLTVYLYINDLQFSKIVIIMASIEVIKIFINAISQKLTKNNGYLYGIIFSFIVFVIGIFIIYFTKNSVLIFIFTTIITACFPFTFIPNMNKYCAKIKTSKNPQFNMTMRDVWIFSLRPVIFLAMLSYNMILGFIMGLIGGTGVLLTNFLLAKNDFKKENN